MDPSEEKKVDTLRFQIKKRPLAVIVSMILDKSVGFYIEDEDGNEIEFDAEYL